MGPSGTAAAARQLPGTAGRGPRCSSRRPAIWCLLTPGVIARDSEPNQARPAQVTPLWPRAAQLPAGHACRREVFCVCVVAGGWCGCGRPRTVFAVPGPCYGTVRDVCPPRRVVASDFKHQLTGRGSRGKHQPQAVEPARRGLPGTRHSTGSSHAAMGLYIHTLARGALHQCPRPQCSVNQNVIHHLVKYHPARALTLYPAAM